jgi:hypothetical protein
VVPSVTDDGMTKRSRHRSQPLRSPGQSLDEKIESVINDDFMGFYILAATLWVITAVE